MPYAVAVDIGGTFTDLVAYDHDSRQVVYTKSPTTYGNFVDGILDCFGKAKLDPHAANFVNHGTTLVINSLIQRKGAKAALVTTKGFRDVLEIARGNRPDPFDLHYRRDEPLIPRAVALRGDRAHRQQGRDRDAARRRGAQAARGEAQGARHRGSRDLLHELLRQSGARGAGGGHRCARCCPASSSPIRPR